MLTDVCIAADPISVLLAYMTKTTPSGVSIGISNLIVFPSLHKVIPSFLFPLRFHPCFIIFVRLNKLNGKLLFNATSLIVPVMSAFPCLSHNSLGMSPLCLAIMTSPLPTVIPFPLFALILIIPWS